MRDKLLFFRNTLFCLIHFFCLFLPHCCFNLLHNLSYGKLELTVDVPDPGTTCFTSFIPNNVCSPERYFQFFGVFLVPTCILIPLKSCLYISLESCSLIWLKELPGRPSGSMLTTSNLCKIPRSLLQVFPDSQLNSLLLSISIILSQITVTHFLE